MNQGWCGKMKILYANKYVEIKACKEKKFLDINQRQKIQDMEALNRLSQTIKYYTDVTKYDSIVFTLDNTDISNEFNLFQEQYFSEICQSGIKNLLIVIPDDEKRGYYQQELQGFNTTTGLNIEFFKNEQNAMQWFIHQPKEILIDQWDL